MNKIKWLLVALCIIGLVGVRVLENKIFYDPFLKYFASTSTNPAFPQFEWAGLIGSHIFRFLYPGDTGISKFGLETYNGLPHHYAFDADALAQYVYRLSELTGVAVYGGDAIVDKEGHFYIIDFNDWPSFSPFRKTMASSIASEITARFKQNNQCE